MFKLGNSLQQNTLPNLILLYDEIIYEIKWFLICECKSEAVWMTAGMGVVEISHNVR